MDDGRYGICERCLQTIGAQTLLTEPASSLCAECVAHRQSQVITSSGEAIDSVVTRMPRRGYQPAAATLAPSSALIAVSQRS